MTLKKKTDEIGQLGKLSHKYEFTMYKVVCVQISTKLSQKSYSLSKWFGLAHPSTRAGSGSASQSNAKLNLLSGYALWVRVTSSYLETLEELVFELCMVVGPECSWKSGVHLW